MPSLFLLYHEVRTTPSSYSYVVQQDAFAEHLQLLARLCDADDPAVRPAITFDDGHLSGFEQAAPLLARHGLHAHFFITAGWAGQRADYMGWQQLRSLHAAGHTIGAHGWSHALLTHCSPAQLDVELVQARAVLEDKLCAPVTAMSLPGGRANPRVLAACRAAGYEQIFTSAPATVSTGREPVVGRLNIRADATAAWLERLLEPQSLLLRSLQRQHRTKETLKQLLGDRLYARVWALLNRKEPALPAAAAP